MNLKYSLFLTLIFSCLIFSCTSKKPDISENTVSPEQPIPAPTRAQRVTSALFAAYPDKIERIEFRNDDWAVLLNDTWFYFAGGRLMPYDELINAADYSPIQFYNYPEKLPAWEERAHERSERSERFRNWTNTERRIRSRRSYFFWDSLWQAAERSDIEARLTDVKFLGWSPTVHKQIQEPLKQVDAEIMAAAKTEPSLLEWIDDIGSLGGYYWRDIAGTVIRSPHSYGTAIDILPKSLKGKQTYWLWTSDHTEEWWTVPYEKRWHPPDTVIKAFENHGFIWGGKWPLFDTMHFEYRPEILVLNGIGM